jgi:hypothetical protein
MAAEILGVLPGIRYETVMDFTWLELKDWHERALRFFKRVHGGET